MKDRHVLIAEVWPNAWYLIVDRGDTIRDIDLYETWMVWATATGPFTHSHHAVRQVKNWMPYIRQTVFVTANHEQYKSRFSVLQWHVILALVANATEPMPDPDPLEPADLGYIDQIVKCPNCGEWTGLESMDEENGKTIVECQGCRWSICVDSLLIALEGVG